MYEFLTLHSTDFLSFVVSVGLVAAYLRYLAWRTRRDPASSAQDQMLKARAAWVACVMQERRDILAVQTFRNSAMAATFMASTAVLLIVGALTLSAQGDKLSETWHALNFAGKTSSEMWLFKLLVLLFDLFIGFFSFAMSVRIFHHLGYLINAPLRSTAQERQIAQAVAQLNRAVSYYRVGMRSYFFSVPLLLWLFGPLWLLGSNLAVLFFLFHMDRAPRRDTDLMG